MDDSGNGASRPVRARTGEDELNGLLAAVARGEQGAFDLLYEQLSGPIAGVVHAVMNAPAQAEEVVQEVLLEIWRTAVRYDPRKGSARTWALMIARRRAIDRIRANAAMAAHELQITSAAASPDQVADAVEETLDRELLLRSLEKLSDPQHKAIVLAFYGRHTYTEVAGLLGIPVGTAKTRIRDALLRLRGLMQAPGTLADPSAAPPPAT
jgi:RNA polymerase sigma-70 factor, ECF subfamily